MAIDRLFPATNLPLLYRPLKIHYQLAASLEGHTIRLKINLKRFCFFNNI